MLYDGIDHRNQCWFVSGGRFNNLIITERIIFSWCVFYFCNSNRNNESAGSERFTLFDDGVEDDYFCLREEFACQDIHESPFFISAHGFQEIVAY